MAKFAKLNVIIGSNITGFTKGLKQAQAKVKGFSASLLKIGSIAAGVGAVLAAAFSVKRFIGAIRSAAQELDNLAKTASLLGIGTEELAAYQHAAKKAGLETTQFNMATQRMVRRIAEAAAGTGEAKAAIAALGLDAQALGKMTPDQQLRELADALADVDDQGERVRLAFKLFDSEGVKILNMLQEGSASLDGAMDRAKKLGIAFSEIQLAQLEEANDAMLDLKTLIGSIARVIAVQLGPLVTAFANTLIDLATTGEDTNTRLIDGLSYVAKAVLKVTNIWDAFKVSVIGLRVLAEGVFQSIVKGIGWMVGKLASALDTMNDLASIAQSFATLSGMKWAEDLAGDIKSATSAASALSAAITESIEEYGDTVKNSIIEDREKIVKILTGPSTAEKLEKFFSKLYADAEKRARARFEGRVKGGGGGFGFDEDIEKKTAAFQQFDPTKVGFGFAASRTPQTVVDTKTHKLLQELVDKVTNMFTGVAQ